MVSYKQVLSYAAQHHGSEKAALALAENTEAGDFANSSDDRLLAILTRCVFNAGFNWKVIEAKWSGFEAAFEGFDPNRVAFFNEDDLDRLLSDERIVRNGQKINATLANARFVVETANTHGSFKALLDEWPADDQVGLMDHLKKNGSRLGGATVQYFLRFAGWDAWITSKDACAALHRDGVLDKPQATSKTALKKVGAAINALHEESRKPRAVLSRLLALSVG